LFTTYLNRYVRHGKSGLHILHLTQGDNVRLNGPELSFLNCVQQSISHCALHLDLSIQLSSQVMSPEALFKLFLYAITILEVPSSLLASSSTTKCFSFRRVNRPGHSSIHAPSFHRHALHNIICSQRSQVPLHSCTSPFPAFVDTRLDTRQHVFFQLSASGLASLTTLCRTCTLPTPLAPLYSRYGAIYHVQSIG
jgi:hypothetical protein